MGFIASIVNKRSTLPLNDAQAWREAGLLGNNPTGVHVTPDNALKYTAVYVCVRIISETLASLPLVVFEKLTPRGRRRATNHYLYPLLHNQPNELMTSMVWRETCQAHILTWGNAYNYLDFNGRGQVTSISPLPPHRMEQVERTAGGLVYHYRLPAGGVVKYPEWRIWHIAGLGYDGLIGYSPVTMARRAIGLGIAADDYGAYFFGNGAQPGGVLQHPGSLTDDAYKRLLASWENRHGGLSNSNRVALLEEGMKYEQIGIPPQDAQFLETRIKQSREIYSIYRVPPHMAGDMERSSYSTNTSGDVEFVSHTMRPWFVRWEQSIHSNLFTDQDKLRYFAEFIAEGLLRGDIKTRFEAYSIARQNGWMSANDIRELENQNPIENGDMYLVPLNMVPAEMVGKTEPAAGGVGDVARSLPAEQEVRAREQRNRADALRRQRLGAIQKPVITEVMSRIVRREVQDITTQAKKQLGKRSLSEFNEWLEGFYRDLSPWIEQQVTPSFRAYSELIATEAGREIEQEPPAPDEFVTSYVATYANRHITRHLAWVKEIAERNQTDPAQFETELNAWKETMPERIAQEESNRLNNGVAKFVYLAGGIAWLRWMSLGETCPYCTSLNGARVKIADYFFPAGASFQPEGAERPMTTGNNIGQPPLHEGCDCILLAGL